MRNYRILLQITTVVYGSLVYLVNHDINVINMENGRSEIHDENMRAIILERELPSRQQAIQGENERRNRTYVAFAIARKLYRCVECADDIPIGSEHVITSTTVKIDGYDHHHVHNRCYRENILPTLGELAIIKSSEVNATKNNRRASRARTRNHQRN